MYGTQIACGMDLLDGMKPGWVDEVDVDNLRLNSCGECVLGQLYGTYGLGMNILGIRDPRYYGFTVPFLQTLPPFKADTCFDVLTREWKDAILFRRSLDGVMDITYEEVLV